MKVVELIWLGQRLTELGHQQLQANAPPGVPRHELVVMSDLIDNTPSTITAITRRTGYAQSRVSAAVASMAERGWVRTEADPADGRRTVVVIPEPLLAMARPYRDAVVTQLSDALLDGVPAARREELMRALEELLAALRERSGLPPI